MTNRIELRSVEMFMEGFKPAYNPIMPLFLDNAEQYAVEAGKVDFRSIDTIGDIRARMYGPKDTEIHQIAAKTGTKSFKKYFFGAQYKQSNLQSTQGYEDVISQVLDEHNKQNDEMFLTGDGQNNGLYTSSDPNYVLNSSVGLTAVSSNYLASLYATMIGLIQDAQQVDGRLLVLTYGTTILPVYNGLFPTNSAPFAKVIGDAADEVSFAKLPTAVTPAGANGFLIVNLDQVKTHYTLLPKVYSQGVNEEHLYAWTNFLMGSSMVEVKQKGAIVRQPLTLV